MKFFLFIITLFPLLSFAKIQPLHVNDSMQVSVYKLENGLTIYLSPNHATPQIYAEIAVRTGGRNDPSDCTGLAHYLEHLMFKGTKKMGTLDYQKEKPHLDKITQLYEQHFKETDPKKRKALFRQINTEAQAAAKFAIASDIDRIYKAIGAIKVNAHTTMDETTYKVSIPANQFERWAKIESERYTEPVFRLFHTELETVYEEKNEAMDNGQTQLWNTTQKHLYPNHPYGTQTVLGKTAHLKSPSILRIHQYHQKYYVPSNMAIMLSGDITPEQALPIIKKYFGKWPAKPTPTQKNSTPTPLAKPHKFTIQHDGEESLMLAWPTASINHPDYPALVIMDMIFNNAAAGLIDLNLINNQLVRNAGSYPHNLNEAGAQYFYATPRQDQTLEQLETLLLQQVELVKQGKFGDWIIPAIVIDLNKRTQLDYLDNAARVGLLRQAFIARQPWSLASQFNTRLAAVTKQDVIRVAKKYLTKNYISGHLTKGNPKIAHIQKPIIDPVALNDKVQSPFAKSVLNHPTQDIKPKFIQQGRDYKKTTSDGISYFTTFNPSNNIFSITWTFPAGSNKYKNLPLAFDILQKSRTKDLTANQLSKKWYQLGISYKTNVYKNHTDITLSGISSSLQQAIPLFWGWIQAPVVEQETLDKLIEDIVIQRSDDLKDPENLIGALSYYSSHGKYSPYINRTSAQELKKLTPKDLQETINKLLSLPHQVSYIGKLPEAQWRPLLPKLTPTAKPQDPIIHPLRKVSQPVEILFIHREMAQAHLWIESHLPQLTYQDQPTLNLFNEYFDGGMSGIVFQELRESRGLAYSAYSYIDRPTTKGQPHFIYGSISSQADKADQALTKFIELYDQLPVSKIRFKESQEALVKRYRSHRYTFLDTVSTIQLRERQQIPFDPQKKNYQQTPTLTLNNILDFHSKHIKGKPKRISIIGDRNRIDFKALNKIAPVKELKIKDIHTP